VAMMLRELGHRRIAYLSPYTLEGTTWVGDRLAGLREVYGNDTVTFLGTELHSAGTAGRIIGDRLFPAVTGAISDLAGGISTHLGPTDSSWVRRQLLGPLRSRLIESSLEPLLEQALRDHSITAWVGANDEVALTALRFLASRRVQVPRQLSVVGFDGSPPAMLAELTTYDFNAPAAAKTALDLVLRPPVKVPGPDLRILDIPGVLAQRPTVASQKT
jgi:DNA-binding LacI/PurR family transcriptional regulator